MAALRAAGFLARIIHEGPSRGDIAIWHTEHLVVVGPVCHLARCQGRKKGGFDSAFLSPLPGLLNACVHSSQGWRPGLVRLRARVVWEVEVLLRHTLSGL